MTTMIDGDVDLEWMLSDTTEDREPCAEEIDSGKECGKEAVAALISDCGHRTPVCVEHREHWAGWLAKHGGDRLRCGLFRGRTDNHWRLVPL
jgi:hypothetical protein